MKISWPNLNHTLFIRLLFISCVIWISSSRHVARSENRRGRAVRARPKSGGGYAPPPLPPPFQLGCLSWTVLIYSTNLSIGEKIARHFVAPLYWLHNLKFEYWMESTSHISTYVFLNCADLGCNLLSPLLDEQTYILTYSAII